MSIRFNALKNYNTGAVSSPKKSGEAKSVNGKVSGYASGKTDTVSISATASDFSAAKVKTTIAANVNSYSSAERISDIKEQVSSPEFITQKVKKPFKPVKSRGKEGFFHSIKMLSYKRL